MSGSHQKKDGPRKPYTRTRPAGAPPLVSRLPHFKGRPVRPQDRVRLQALMPGCRDRQHRDECLCDKVRTVKSVIGIIQTPTGAPRYVLHFTDDRNAAFPHVVGFADDGK